MNKYLLFIFFLLIIEPAFSQKTTTVLKIPYVSITDSSFSTLIDSIIRDAESCSITNELQCGIISRKRIGKSGNTNYSFSIAPFDDLELLIESLWHIKEWRILTLNNIPMIFLYSDSNKFNIIGSVDFTINTDNRVSYQYICTDNDTAEISMQKVYPIRIYETFIYENGEYHLLYKDPWIDISDAKRKDVSKHEVLYIIRK